VAAGALIQTFDRFEFMGRVLFVSQAKYQSVSGKRADRSEKAIDIGAGTRETR
jgi:hypothetical protein